MSQTTLTQSKIVEKVIRDQSGRFVRATFCLYESQGRIKARLLNFVFLDEKTFKNNPLALSGFTPSKISSPHIYSFCAKTSPYVALNALYSSGSKPRAPTL